MTDFPHYVKIEMGTRQGWWRTAEHVRLMDPETYAEKVYKNTNWCLGVRITSHDDGTVWISGGAVPDTSLKNLGSMPPVPERDLGVGHPSDPKSRDLRAHWDDVLGDTEVDTEVDTTTPSESQSAPEPQAKSVDTDASMDDVLGEADMKPCYHDILSGEPNDPSVCPCGDEGCGQGCGCTDDMRPVSTKTNTVLGVVEPEPVAAGSWDDVL